MSEDPTNALGETPMSVDETFEDFALGVMRVCDENLEMNKQRDPNYPEGDEIDYNDLYQSCASCFWWVRKPDIRLNEEEYDPIGDIERWVEHERWCVRALAQGVKHLLQYGSFNLGPDIGVDGLTQDEINEDFDSFVVFVDSVR